MTAKNISVMKSAKAKIAFGIAAAALLAAGMVNTALAGTMGNDRGSVGKASAQEKVFANEIMKATADENYQAFIADGDRGFKSITQAQFGAVCQQVDSRLKTGYRVIFWAA